MERYRSGHNGADSKSVCGKPHEGSNPSLSANGTRINPAFMRVFHTYISKSKQHLFWGTNPDVNCTFPPSGISFSDIIGITGLAFGITGVVVGIIGCLNLSKAK